MHPLQIVRVPRVDDNYAGSCGRHPTLPADGKDKSSASPTYGGIKVMPGRGAGHHGWMRCRGKPGMTESAIRR